MGAAPLVVGAILAAAAASSNQEKPQEHRHKPIEEPMSQTEQPSTKIPDGKIRFDCCKCGKEIYPQSVSSHLDHITFAFECHKCGFIQARSCCVFSVNPW